MSDLQVRILVVTIVAIVIGVGAQLVHLQTIEDVRKVNHELCEESQKLRAALLLTVPEGTATIIEQNLPARECPSP